MEILAVLIGLLFLASPIIAFIALAGVNGLRRDIAQLRRELDKVKERGLTSSSRSQPPVAVKDAISNHPAPKPKKAAALDNLPQELQANESETQPPQVKSTAQMMKEKAQRHAEKTVFQLSSKTPEKPKPTIEERIGSQWSVWVGGLALAVGAVFLLRYSIEAGVFSPAMRLGLAAIMGLGALAGGEWMRRGDPLGDTLKIGSGDKALLQQAYIPGVLTAVGIFTWLGVIYTGHALYGFFGAGIAFTLLGVTSLLGLALGLLHGPKIAALGLLAAFVTPLLVGTNEPNYMALYGYLLLIAGAALTLAQKRNWPEITVMALFGLLGWCFLSIGALDKGASIVLWAGFAAFSYGIGTWAAQQPDRLEKKNAEAISLLGRSPELSLRFNSQVLTIWTLVLAAIFMIASLTSISREGSQTIWVGLSLSALFILNGARWRDVSLHIIIGGVLAVLTLLMSKLSMSLTLIIMAIISLSIWALCFRESRALHADSSTLLLDRPVWAGVSAGLPLIGWVLALLKFGGNASSSGWLRLSDIGRMEGVIYIGLALLFAGTAEYLWRKNERSNPPINIYAVASGVAIFCAILFCVDIDVKFYVYGLCAAAGFALYLIRPLISLRFMSVGALALALLLAIFHHIQGNDVGTRYIFNALWIYLAAPAALCFAGAWVLQRVQSDICSEGLKAASLSSAALFIVMQIHHLMNSGQVLATNLSLEEAALFVLTGLCFTFGASWMERGVSTSFKDRAPHEKLMPILSIGFSLVTLCVFILVVGILMNPLWNEYHLVKGNLILNSLLLAYLLPALLCGAIAIWSHGSRPLVYVRGMAALGFVSFMIYITAMVRFVFTGAQMSIFDQTVAGAELYAISAVWLVIGIGLLGLGVTRKNRDIRMVSGLVIILTVLKAFLIDMSNLEGVLRAMSFVILGLVLIVIGRVYQKLIFSDQEMAAKQA